MTKPLTRQQRFQRRLKEAGKCPICSGVPVLDMVLCANCREKRLKRGVKRYANTKFSRSSKKVLTESAPEAMVPA